MKKLYALLLAALLAISLTRCGQLTQEPASGTFANVYQKTLSTACVRCHVPGGSANDAGATLDFSTQALAYSTLTSTTVSATSSASICSGVRIVKAGDATNSYLAGVLFSDYYKSNFGGVSGCTPYNVHLSDQNLSDAEKTSILAWINNGASQ